MVFDQPIVGLVGGLHYPDKDAKVLQRRIDFLKSLNLQIVVLSLLSCGESAIAAIREAFPEASRDIKVGQPIAFGQ